MSVYILPFGKHKGENIEDVPTQYLQWAYDTWDFSKVWVKDLGVGIEIELLNRQSQEQTLKEHYSQGFYDGENHESA